MEDCADSSPTNSRTHEEPSALVATELKPLNWTDEKHCLFLKSMESMFINQLYKSIDTHGWHSRKNCPSGSRSSKYNATSVRSSGQFKVLRSGSLSKIEFQRKGDGGDQEEGSNVPSARNLQLHVTRKEQVSHSTASLDITGNQIPQHHLPPARQVSVGSNTEVMDQNFNDEDFEGEQSVGTHNAKTTGASSDVTSSADQVVPVCDDVLADNVNEDLLYYAPKE